MRPSWDEYFMILAKIAASRSTCLSRPVGGILVLNRQVLVTGYNGSIPGGTHCSDEGACFKRKIQNSKNDKYDYCRASHAESNLLAQAAKKGINIEGASLYITLSPCYNCTKQLAVAGIKEVVYEQKYKSEDSERDEHWMKALEEKIISRKLTVSSTTLENIYKNFLMPSTSDRRLE